MKISTVGALLAGAVGAATVAVFVMQAKLVAGFDYKDNMAEAAAGTATGLLAVTLFVERAISVINAIVYGDAQRKAELRLLGSNQAQGAADLARVLTLKERLRLFGAFVAGLFVSAAGVRTLEGLLKTDGTGVSQNDLLFPVDIIFTAGLIAGGSNGLAFLLQVIKDTLTRTPMNKPGLRTRLVTTG